MEGRANGGEEEDDNDDEKEGKEQAFPTEVLHRGESLNDWTLMHPSMMKQDADKDQ